MLSKVVSIKQSTDLGTLVTAVLVCKGADVEVKAIKQGDVDDHIQQNARFQAHKLSQGMIPIQYANGLRSVLKRDV